MSGEYLGPRIAPEKMEKEPLPLDVVVVIPSHNEGYDIVDTVESIARQIKEKGTNVVHGIVVVINNRSDASSEVLASNLQTYLLLQGLRHGCNMSMRGNPEIAEKIKRIQDTKIPIHIVDSFSPGHAHSDSNVGRARKEGTDHAVSRLARRDSSVVISTDADTILGPYVIASVNRAFTEEGISATPLSSRNTTEKLDPVSERAFRNYALYWGIANLHQTMPYRLKMVKHGGIYDGSFDTPLSEEDAIWFAGASSAFRKDMYEKVGGYREIPGEEDTKLGIDIVESGGVLKDLSEEYPGLAVYTKPRISHRTTTGYGRTIAKWDETEKPFQDVVVPSPEAVQLNRKILHELDAFRGIEEEFIKDGEDPAEIFKDICVRIGKMSDVFASELRKVYENWGDKANNQYHHQFLEMIKDYYEIQYPSVTTKESIAKAEKLCARYSRTLDRSRARPTLPDASNTASSSMPWKWERFSEVCSFFIKEIGVSTDENTMAKVRAITTATYDKYMRSLLVTYNEGLFALMFSGTQTKQNRKVLAVRLSNDRSFYYNCMPLMQELTF